MADGEIDVKKELRAVRVALLLLCCLVAVVVVVVCLGYSDFRTYLHHQQASSQDMRMETLFKEKKYGEALSLAKRRMKNAPDDASGYYDAGTASYHMGQYQDAVKYLEKAERLAPTWHAEYTGPYIQKSKEMLSTATQPTGTPHSSSADVVRSSSPGT